MAADSNCFSIKIVLKILGMPLKLQQNEHPVLNLTPMIDVVFLLIIFFMVATKFTDLEPSIQLKIPQAAAADEHSEMPTKHLVHVTAAGEIYLQEAAISLTELTEKLLKDRARNPDLQVIIRGDEKCEYQYIAAVMGVCRKAKVKMGVAVKVASKSSTPNIR